VSVTLGPDEFAPSDLGTKPDSGVITNDKMCDAAQQAARAIVG
jgi:hypothetical protein